MPQNINIINCFGELIKKLGLQFLAISFLACSTFLISVAVAGTLTQIEIHNRMYNLYVLDSGQFPEAIKVMNNAGRLIYKFQNKDIAQQVANCDFMIDLPVGTVNGNHSYGGYCSTKIEKGLRTKSFIVCADILVGHFKAEELIIEDSQSPQEINALAEFVVKNCTGG